MLKTGAVWHGQKGNHKGNLFPLFGQKMDFSAQKQGKFALVWLITNCQGKTSEKTRAGNHC
jgi:hypothetical protein